MREWRAGETAREYFNAELWNPKRDAALIHEAEADNSWLESLLDVVENDPDATQNWFIPNQLLSFMGYGNEEMMEEYQEQRYQGILDNEDLNRAVQDIIKEIINQNEIRINTLRRRELRGREATWELFSNPETMGQA